ncbi:hypothetical protein CLOM_g17818 [Closterium sp. NIES-68]|nr:hypothetical protein CLOM_g17818 [Closterium sp. NIES-68]GJP85029.1 hypothetical protein CLOP_g15066 [Closterium sp. NIES-67]
MTHHSCIPHSSLVCSYFSMQATSEVRSWKVEEKGERDGKDRGKGEGEGERGVGEGGSGEKESEKRGRFWRDVLVDK